MFECHHFDFKVKFNENLVWDETYPFYDFKREKKAYLAFFDFAIAKIYIQNIPLAFASGPEKRKLVLLFYPILNLDS